MKNMTDKFRRFNFGLFCAVIIAGAMLLALAQTVKAERVPLEVTDCVKCHQDEPATIAKNGGKHKTEVTCLDCHEEHPPWGKNVIPKCQKCHEGKSHFELENCLRCHSNPHEPLALHLAPDVKDACLTCHEGPGQDFANYPSKHAEQYCTFCHEVHGQIPECTKCHEPHVEGQVSSDCLGCHPAHHPLQITPALTTPRSFCIACHEEEGIALAKTTTKHQTFTCAFCHRTEHPSIPHCRNCHGEPHAPAIHKKMPKCLDCHLDAHNLVK